MRRTNRSLRRRALTTAFALVPVACGTGAHISAPKAQEAVTSTTDPGAALPPTSAVGPDPETAAGHAAAIGVGSTIPVPANSIASGPLPVASNSGLASWYDAAPRTTASRDYPQGTRLQVCRGDACVVVTVADYGPSAATGRALDLSADSFAAVAPLSRGVVQVSWSVVG